ncbi:hypothetical protein [Parafilimonas sp.]|uniref:hypothetical protein n=1 Tax=Parafilimonas sp. TaxID=1969739 RepID=UPI0039E3AC2F
MRSIILTATLLFALSVSSFASPKAIDTKLFNDLSNAFRKCSQVSWVSKATYNQASFNFKNQQAMVFYSNDNELIGFSIQISRNNLPEVVANALKEKYSNWAVTDAIMFIDTYGYASYYVQVATRDASQVLKISPNGRLHIYTKVR